MPGILQSSKGQEQVVGERGSRQELKFEGCAQIIKSLQIFLILQPFATAAQKRPITVPTAAGLG